MLRKRLEPKREDVAGDWRKFRYQELHDLYCSSAIIRIITSTRTVVRHVGEENCAQSSSEATQVTVQKWKKVRPNLLGSNRDRNIFYY